MDSLAVAALQTRKAVDAIITPFGKHVLSAPSQDKVDFGRTATVALPFRGDVVHKIHLCFRLPELTLEETSGSSYLGWTNTIGYSMIDSVQVRMGDVPIHEPSGVFLDIMRRWILRPTTMTRYCAGNRSTSTQITIRVTWRKFADVATYDGNVVPPPVEILGTAELV
ncbi:hypothetical protein BC832DRAFT_620781 [Gaertneriomyces semiglobifer]|nr:hypothetical protein BC832DRAFT_620781 [Gaertneriomyces semiglobifer]